MKIDGIWLSTITSTQNIKKARPEDTKPASGKDGVMVSDKANVFKNLLQKAQEMPDIREQKVAELKEQIANGSFKVDASRIAQILFSEDK